MGDNRASIASSNADTQELLDPVLTSNADGSFKSLRTIPAFR